MREVQEYKVDRRRWAVTMRLRMNSCEVERGSKLEVAEERMDGRSFGLKGVLWSCPLG